MEKPLGRAVSNHEKFTEKDLEFKGKTLAQLARWHQNNLLYKKWREQKNTE